MNSAFTFKAKTETVISSDGDCSIVQNVTQSLPHHQIYDWVDINVSDCIQAGDILWRNPTTGNYELASATSETSQVVGVVEETAGCDAEKAKLVYQGRIDFPVNYQTRNGAIYYLADTQETNQIDRQLYETFS